MSQNQNKTATIGFNFCFKLQEITGLLKKQTAACIGDKAIVKHTDLITYILIITL
jgi:hypothetical protein